EPAVRPRLFGTAVLLGLLVNTHSFYYDMLLLLVPASAWWIGGSTYARTGVRRALGWLVGIVYLGSYVGVWFEVYMIVLAPLLVAWLVLEITDLAGERMVSTARCARTPP
ncbi:MAG TPA: hypothetical protein VNI78_04140, partial [Vicinamibacterales bacterium]|nr:hypothetical protein [Vicinamibacterales bacterium]